MWLDNGMIDLYSRGLGYEWSKSSGTSARGYSEIYQVSLSSVSIVGPQSMDVYEKIKGPRMDS